MSVLLIINFVLFLITVYASYLNTANRLKMKGILFITALFSVVYFLVMGIAGLFFKTLENLNCIAFCIAGAVILIASFAVKMHCSKLSCVFFKALMIYLILETVVFNFNSYKLLTVDSPMSEELDISGQTAAAIGGDEQSIEFTDINKEIGTLKITAHSQNNDKMTFDIDYADATSKEYRRGIAKAEPINDSERSQIVPINASGEISRLKIRFKAKDNDIVTVKDVSINTPIPFRFSIIRLIAILMFALLKYILCDSERFSRPLGEDFKLCALSARIVTVLFIIIAFLLVLSQRSDGLKNINKDFLTDSGNQITKDIVDAFEHKQVSMLEKVDPRLEALDNPYDPSQRDGISYPWDHLYYNGKYYSYYGIATVFLLFLPYHLITGHYFPSQWAVFLFGALGIYFLYKFYIEYMKEFFKDISINLVLMGLVMIQLISGIWFCFPTPNFYEIAQTSGFMFCAGGFFFLMRSGVIGGKKISLPYIAASSVMFALGVLSRPTLALYCICALIFIYAGVLKIKKTGEKNIYSFLCAAIIPFIIFGAVQMIYNFARFGSPFDFGIEYSLTINDFVNAQYHSHFVGIGLYNFLAALPSFEETFPFISFPVKLFQPNGYYFVANYTAVGLLWLALPIFSYIYSRRAYLMSENENKKLYGALIFAVCIAAPVIIMASVWESGYAARYRVDFACQILIGALTVAFIIYGGCKNDGVKKILTKALFASVVICFVLNFAQIYSFTTDLGGFNHSALDKYMFMLERAFEFWR